MGNCKCCDSQPRVNNELILNTDLKFPKIPQTPTKKIYTKFEDSPSSKSLKGWNNEAKEIINQNNIEPNYVSCPVVFDIGSFSSRIGFSQQDNPKYTFPTVLGVSDKDPDRKLFGLQATENKVELLHLKSPLERGFIEDWTTMENIWEYCFEKLGYSQVEDCRCLLTEIIDNSKENRMKTCQYFFERFGTSKFLLMNQSVLSLYNAAKTNGVIIDSGYSNTYVVPIYEGYALHSQVGKLKISGMDIENYLQKSLIEKDRKFTSRKFRNTLNELMKNNCYYALDYEFETKKASKREQNQSFTLPDGENLILGQEMFGCTEILFNPKLLGSKNEGVHINLKNTLENLDNDLVFDYSNNITFAGGTTMIKGFLERIKKEFEKLWGNKKFSMKYNEKNINSAWLGGSLVSNLSSFQTEFIDKKEYEEYGSIIIQRKCFY